MLSNVFEIFTSICVALIARALHQWICFSAVSLSAVSSLHTKLFEPAAYHITDVPTPSHS